MKALRHIIIGVLLLAVAAGAHGVAPSESGGTRGRDGRFSRLANKLDVDSEPGRGTTVVFSLPQGEAE